MERHIKGTVWALSLLSIITTIMPQDTSTVGVKLLELDSDQSGRLSSSDYQNAEERRFVRTPTITETNDANDVDIFEGDIISSDEDYDLDLTTDENKKWPTIGQYVVVPFTFPSTATEQEKADIARMVIEFKNKTCDG